MAKGSRAGLPGLAHECLFSLRCRIDVSGFWYEGETYEVTYPGTLDDYARRDGFADWCDLLGWFEHTHGLPFEGQLIGWLTPVGGV